MALDKNPFSQVGKDLIQRKEKQAPEPNTIDQDNKYGNQGRKGHRLKRINMGFTDLNHAFIKSEADRQGIWMSELVNNIIADYRERNQ